MPGLIFNNASLCPFPCPPPFIFWQFIQALNHKTLRPPFPREAALDNLAKFRRLLPRPPVSAAAAAGTGTDTVAEAAEVRDIAGGRGGGGATAAVLSPTTPRSSAGAAGAPGAARSAASSGIVSPPRVGERLARDTTSVRAGVDVPSPGAAAVWATTTPGGSNTMGAGKPQSGFSSAGAQQNKSGGGSVGGHYGPTVGSAAEIDRMDKEMASKRRSAELLLASGEAPAGTVTRHSLFYPPLELALHIQ